MNIITYNTNVGFHGLTEVEEMMACFEECKKETAKIYGQQVKGSIKGDFVEMHSSVIRDLMAIFSIWPNQSSIARITNGSLDIGDGHTSISMKIYNYNAAFALLHEIVTMQAYYQANMRQILNHVSANMVNITVM